MMFLERVYFGNTVQDWIIAGAFAVATFIVLKVALRIVIRRLGKLAGRTRTEIDDFVVGVLQKTRLFFLVAVALYAGSKDVYLTVSWERILDIAVILAVIVQAGFWASGALMFWIHRSVDTKMKEDAASATTMSALSFLGRLVIWVVVLLLALDNLGVNITALVTGLGIGGIAVALALQNILGDLFASLSIVLDKPFVIGDFIIVNEYLGSVEYIGLKTTRIRSLSGEQIIFSNSDLLKSRIRNYKRMQERRVLFSLGVTYQTPHDKLARIGAMLRNIVEGRPDTRFDRAHFQGYGDSSLNFEIVYYVKSPDYNTYMDIQQEINLEIYRQFEEEGIEFAFPTRTLYITNGGTTVQPVDKKPLRPEKESST